MKALVTGATGFIGSRLVTRLENPRVLTRDPDRARRTLGPGVAPFPWDASRPPPPEALRGVDAVFHLAGDPIASGRWTAAKKEAIRESRVAGTRNLVAALAGLPGAERPRVLVSASAVGFYGDRGDEVLDESCAPGLDFLAGVCRDWEAEAARAGSSGIRVVTPRFGVVLGPGGGALARMLPPFRLGLGGRLGSGRQWMSWIHRDDLIGLLLHAAGQEGLSGPMNAVSPTPVTNREFTKALGTALHRPAVFPVPAPVLRLAFGEMAGVLLASQRVLPRVAGQSGYAFRHPELLEALAEAIGK